MIDVHCPHCGRVLIGSRQILSLTGGEGGIEVAYVCGCGRLGSEVVGPSRRRATRSAPPARAEAGNDRRPDGVWR